MWGKSEKFRKFGIKDIRKDIKKIPANTGSSFLHTGKHVPVRHITRFALSELTNNRPHTAVQSARTTKHDLPPGYMQIIVELPRGSKEKTRRTFWVPRDATAGKVLEHLARHFNVDKDSWNLYGSKREGETPLPILDMGAEVSEYSKDKNEKAQLYFYPEVLY